ncbi:MAG: hypothetical protein GY870_09630 [archaeon]|nr:hypothetical protein [archaeon]
MLNMEFMKVQIKVLISLVQRRLYIFIIRSFGQLHKSLLTIPIMNFIECSKGNFQYLQTKKFNKIGSKNLPELAELFETIVFQIEDVDLLLYTLEYEIELNKNLAITEKSKDYIQKANELEYEFNRLMNIKKNQKTQTLLEQVAIINKEMPFQIDVFTTTMAMFFQYRKLLENGKAA